MNTGRLEKLARGHHLFENVPADKKILAAIDFTESWRTSGVGDRIAKILHNLQHMPDDRAFASARR